MKVKDEILLSDWVHKIVIPTKLKSTLAAYIPSDLMDRIVYIENDCKDIWDWSEKVYRIIEKSTDRSIN
jgi:CO dehydrogenase/acetyl-CoA synthase beta subunit